MTTFISICKDEGLKVALNYACTRLCRHNEVKLTLLALLVFGTIAGAMAIKLTCGFDHAVQWLQNTPTHGEILAYVVGGTVIGIGGYFLHGFIQDKVDCYKVKHMTIDEAIAGLSEPDYSNDSN